MPVSLSRRGFLAGSSSLVALFSALHARRLLASREPRLLPGPYGPVRPARDLATGLPLLLLPEGFQYRSYSWSGDPMSNGEPAPNAHDGMGVIAVHGSGRSREIVLVRNHERAMESPILAPARYDRSSPAGAGSAPAGGTTTLRFRHRDWISAAPSLGGTIYNCAGGVTPWNTWLSCEETVLDLTARGGRRHGYVFEVRENPAESTATPIVGMGRMLHEAVAIDPETNVAYLTEDHPYHSGFYRFVPRDTRGAPGSYEAGGRLQAARVAGRPNADLRNPQVGDRWPIEWVDVDEPDADPGVAPADISTIPAAASGPFLQAWARGALRMSRGEGVCHHRGKLFVVDTEGGIDREGRPGRGEGALWTYDLAAHTLTCLFVSPAQHIGDNIDNVTVSPRGGVLLCEDGQAGSGAHPTGTRLLGITRDGDSYEFARNNVNVALEDLSPAGKRIPPGDYRAEEWAGACFDPAGEVLFANIQRPGITLAIWGPWERGEL